MCVTSRDSQMTGSVVWGSFKYVEVYHCPDLLEYTDIGAADNWRGRVIRGFFWVMRAWPVKGPTTTVTP